MPETIHTFVTSVGLAVLAALCLGGLVKSAVRRLAKQGILLCLIGCGFLQSMAGNSAPSKSEDWIGAIYVPTNAAGIPEGQIVVDSGTKVTITVTGLPKKGLTYDKANQSFAYDEETLPDGNYALVVSAKNANGYKNDKVVTFVSEEHATEKDPLDWGESYYVGQTCDIACDEFVAQSKTDSLTLKGLPSGLKLVKYTDGEGLPVYRIEGTPTKAGRSTVTWTEKHAQAAVAVQYYMIVDGAPSKYVEACDDDLPSGCKVSGSNVYDAGKKITLKATAAKGLVFAGWYEDAAFETPVAADVDYRNPTLTLTDVAQARDVYYPRFIGLKEDFCGEILVPELNEAGVPEGVVAVESESLPTITVSGLPTFLTFDKKTNALVFNAAKAKVGDYAFVISAKNAGGYKNDQAVTFVYGEPEDVPESWWTDYTVGQIVYEQVDSNLTGLPTGLKCVKETDEFGETVYFISGIPTKPGRFTAKMDGDAYYMIVQGAPSRYVEVVVDDGAPTGCKATGSGVYAAGATVKTSATAAKNSVFADWNVAYMEGDETLTNALYNVYADYLGKDGDPRVAAQTWLSGTYENEDGEVIDILPLAPGERYVRLLACFAGSEEDADEAIVIRAEDETDIDEAWNVRIDDGAHTTFGDDHERIVVSVDSVSAPKLTVKGTISGITIKNYGTWAELSCDPNGKTMPKPGEYTLTFTAVNQSKVTVTRTLTVRVPNELAIIGGLDVLANLDTSVEGHFAMTVGESMVDVYADDPEQLTTDYLKTDVGTLAENGITITGITVKNLPSGVTCKDGYFSGVPTKAGVYTMTLTVTGTQWGQKVTATATAFFRVEEIDTTCVGTFNGAVYDADGAADGTISATVSAAGKLTSCKLIDLKGKATSITLKTQSFLFLATEGRYEIQGEDKDGDVYKFELYPAEIGEEGTLPLGGYLEVTKYSAEANSGEAPSGEANSGEAISRSLQKEENSTSSSRSGLETAFPLGASPLWTAEAQQNVWSDKAYKAAGLLPGYSSVSVDYEEDALALVFKSAGAVTAARGKKSASARFELTTYDESAGWTGRMTVNVPDGTEEGYCKTFDVEVSADSEQIEIKPVE